MPNEIKWAFRGSWNLHNVLFSISGLIILVSTSTVFFGPI